MFLLPQEIGAGGAGPGDPGVLVPILLLVLVCRDWLSWHGQVPWGLAAPWTQQEVWLVQEALSSSKIHLPCPFPPPPAGRQWMGMGTLPGAVGALSRRWVLGDTWHPEGHREGIEAGRHRQSRGWELGAGWCWDPAGSQLGPGQLLGPPAWSEFARAQPAAASPAWGQCTAPQPAALARPRRPSPAWAGGHPTWPPSPAGSLSPLSEAKPSRGPERRSQLRRLPCVAAGGGGGHAARWSRLRAAIFLGGESWGEMDALTRGGATAGECQPRGGEQREREPSPSPSPSLSHPRCLWG